MPATRCGGAPPEQYLGELAAVRRGTLDALAARDDAWLEGAVGPAPRINAHWAWFHVAEDEINHRGQIRWLCARACRGETPPRVSPSESSHLTRPRAAPRGSVGHVRGFAGAPKR